MNAEMEKTLDVGISIQRRSYVFPFIYHFKETIWWCSTNNQNRSNIEKWMIMSLNSSSIVGGWVSFPSGV